MTDKELLEYAAKAAGVEIHEGTDGTLQNRPVWMRMHFVMGQPYCEVEWNPLREDGDCMRLSVRLRMEVDHNHLADSTRWVSVRGYPSKLASVEEFEDESQRFQATRRAIVRAAAEIGKAMP